MNFLTKLEVVKQTKAEKTTNFGQRRASESEEMHPLDVALETTDLYHLLELVVRQRQTVPLGLNRSNRSQHLRTELYDHRINIVNLDLITVIYRRKEII